MGAMQMKKQLDYEVGDDDALYRTRPPSSARKYIQPVNQVTHDDPDIDKGAFIQRKRASANSTPTSGIASKAITSPTTETWRGVRRFPIMAIILGMIVMALLAYGLSAFGAWWQIHQDDVTYGRPRTFQLDAVVGHVDSASNPTHFIFLNLNRHIEIIELPGGDGSHARIFTGPTLFGDGQDLTPVTGVIKDVNGDGKPDLIVQIQEQRLVFINTGTTFRPLQPGEHINL